MLPIWGQCNNGAEFSLVRPPLSLAISNSGGQVMYRRNRFTSFRCERLEDRCQPSSSLPSDLTPVNDRLYFVADDGIHGRELFISNGTAAGTGLVKDIFPGQTSSQIRFLTPFGNRLVFTADDGAHGFELWIFDGTIGGTNLVKDISNSKDDSFPSAMAVIDGVVYFAASTSQQGRELWRSDGTEAGTVLVSNISTGDWSSSPS